MSNAITDSVVSKVVKHLFGDSAKSLVRFSFVEDAEYGPEEYLNFAEKAHSLGMKIDLEEFKRLSNLSFISVDEQWQPAEEDVNKDWSPEDKAKLKETEEFKLNA